MGCVTSAGLGAPWGPLDQTAEAWCISSAVTGCEPEAPERARCVRLAARNSLKHSKPWPLEAFLTEVENAVCPASVMNHFVTNGNLFCKAKEYCRVKHIEPNSITHAKSWGPCMRKAHYMRDWIGLPCIVDSSGAKRAYKEDHTTRSASDSLAW